MKTFLRLLGLGLLLIFTQASHIVSAAPPPDALSFLKKQNGEWYRVTRARDGSPLRIEKTDAPATPEIARTTNSGLFETYQNIPTGSWPEAVAVGDVNNDGRADVVLTTSSYSDPDNDFKLFVFLQQSNGSLAAAVKYPAGNGDSVDVGDLNNDGRTDVVVSAANAIGVFIQKANGALESMVTYPLSNSNNSFKVRVGDFNNDGRDDVASIDWGLQSDDVDVFLQTANGTFNAAVTYSVAHDGYDDLKVGDVNHDAKDDIVVMSGQGLANNVGVLTQNAQGTFDNPVYDDIPGNVLTHGVAVGDVNNDTFHDIVASYGGNSPDANLGIFLQNQNGTLDYTKSYTAYDIPEPVAIGDLNRDGHNDVITAHGGWLAMGVFLQDTNGDLLPYETYPLPYASHYNPHGLALGDVNGDGCADAAIADYNNGLVLLYRAVAAPPLISPIQGFVTPLTRVRLKWKKVCAREYNVEVRRDSAQGELVAQAAGLTKTKFKTPPLEKGHSYFWRIEACNHLGCEHSEWRKFKISK